MVRCKIDEITPLSPSVSAVGPSNSSKYEESSSSMADIGNSMVWVFFFFNNDTKHNKFHNFFITHWDDRLWFM